jgi:adenylate cyclase
MAASRSTLCKGHLSQMRIPMPIRGPAALPLKMLGMRVSRMNPNLCSLCETMFRLLMKTRRIEITATILFADVRGYTGLSEALGGAKVAEVLDRFYEICSVPIWERDGIVLKLIGDAVFALFNFPITRDDHARMAVESAVEMQARCKELSAAHSAAGDDSNGFGIGIGIHSGRVTIGDIGEFCKDFTAIGDIVNVAARLQGAAQPGEVLMSETVYSQVADLLPEAVEHTFTLKGVSRPVSAYAVSPAR